MLWERRADDDYKPVPYFVLGDVWDSFAEWSAYGTGVPLVLNNNKDRVIQYYVPSLSAIQIYAHSHALNSSLKSRFLFFLDSSYQQHYNITSFHYVGSYITFLYGRRPGDSSDSDFRDSSSSDSDSEQVSARVDRISLRDQHQEDSSSDDGEPLGSQGRLIFEYLERDLPYIREPLADKVCAFISLLEPHNIELRKHPLV